ncbi:MAG: UDP-N-acetylglucosamine 2-epimerase (non-hydrolyzing) [Kofleriaceae bacterium]
MPITLLAIAGTRPELVKLAPVIRAIKERGGGLAVKTVFSGQHVEILESVVADFDVAPDVDLRVPMTPRTLSQTVAWLLEGLDKVVAELKPDGVIVQGDTNTAFVGALVAMHHKLPVFHVEAGLRTPDLLSPFPEEANRRLVGRIAALHFAPTDRAAANLVAEGIAEDVIHVTGNTGIDALAVYAQRPSAEADAILARLTPGSRRMLVTLHRRENQERVSEVTSAIRRLRMSHPDLEVVWILHANGIRAKVIEGLEGVPGVHLLEPQPYGVFVHLMKAVDLVASDSGGVQEEAPVFGKPVLILRDETERGEAVDAGCARLVGCDAGRIVATAQWLLGDAEAYATMSRAKSPFGDGRASSASSPRCSATSASSPVDPAG